MVGVLIKRGRFGEDRNTEEKHMLREEVHVKMEAEIRVLQNQA